MIRYILFVVFAIFSLLFFSCTNEANKTSINITNFDTGFSLYQDTVFVDIEGEMTHALKYQDKFYVLFEQSFLEHGNYSRLLYIFSSGKIEKIIDLPQKIGVGYLDFFVKNDSIIIKPYMETKYYYFDTLDLIFKEIEKIDDLIFEDEKFYVYSLDFGEWGGMTWFKEKKTDIEYYIEIATPLVNKIDSAYYLTTYYEVIKINNPLQLNKCDNDLFYENFERKGKEFYLYNESADYSVIYNDTTYPYFTPNFPFKYKPRIVSSFAWQNELFHIYETDSITYIAKIENNSIKPIEIIDKELFFYNYHASYRCRNIKGNNELLKFRTKDEHLFGLMEMVDNTIFIHYIVNQADINYE